VCEQLAQNRYTSVAGPELNQWVWYPDRYTITPHQETLHKNKVAKWKDYHISAAPIVSNNPNANPNLTVAQMTW